MYAYVWPMEARKRCWIPWARVVGCEQPNVDARNWILDFCKSNKHLYLLSLVLHPKCLFFLLLFMHHPKFFLMGVLAEGQRRCGCSSAVLSGPLCCALSPCVRNWAGYGFAVITFSLPLALNFLNTVFCSLCLDQLFACWSLHAVFPLCFAPLPSSSLRTSVPQRIAFYVVVQLLMIDMASLCSDLEWIAVRHRGLGFVSILVLIPLWKSYSTIYLWLVLDKNPLPFP